MYLFFALIGFITVASAIGVIAFRNPMRSALCLILHLLGVAGLFALLEAHFLATVQVVVYAGAIMVLVLFVVMLLNVKVEKVRPLGVWYVTIGAFCLAGFLAILLPSLHSLFVVFPDVVLPLVGGAQEMGRVIYTEYLFPFEIASLLIFAAIAGAVMVAKRSYAPTPVVATSQLAQGEDK